MPILEKGGGFAFLCWLYRLFVRHKHLLAPSTNEEMWNKSDREQAGGGDMGMDEVLREFLSREFGLPVLSEEVAHCWPPEEENFWLVDPRDGTHNSKMGLPLTGSMASLFREGLPVLTAVFVAAENTPAGGGFYCAARGEGAWLWQPDQPPVRLGVSAETDLQQARLLLEGPSKSTMGDLRALRLANRSRLVRLDLGFAVSITRLAQGAVETVLSLRNKPTDNLHGILLCEEAGGRVTDLEGNPPSLKNCADLVFSNGTLHASALDAMH